MAKNVMQPQLWAPRSVGETLEIYTDWADTYDIDVRHRGYVTPMRVAKALSEFLAAGQSILDFGCGTGLSGAALKEAGLSPVDGTDITSAMVEEARAKNIYRELWVSEPDAALPEGYGAIVATGVVSLGAAPPETFDLLLDAVAPGALIALTFNDPTLEDGRYDAHLDTRNAAFDTLFREHGPHLTKTGMGADVMVLRRK